MAYQSAALFDIRQKRAARYGSIPGKCAAARDNGSISDILSEGCKFFRVALRDTTGWRVHAASGHAETVWKYVSVDHIRDSLLYVAYKSFINGMDA